MNTLFCKLFDKFTAPTTYNNFINTFLYNFFQKGFLQNEIYSNEI